MKLQLTKTKTIEFPRRGAGGRSAAAADMVGVELFGGDARGVPAVRVAYRKSAWHLVAADFVKPPAGALPERWEDVSNRSDWELPAAFQTPHAAIAVNSQLSLFSQATADTVQQDMAHGIPAMGAVHSAVTSEPGKKRFSIRRGDEPAPSASAKPSGGAPAKFPDAGAPTAVNGMRFTVRPLAEDGQYLEAAIPEFQVLWLSRLLPEGHRPTASSVQPAEAALMASVLAQPALAESGGNALVMFMQADAVFFAGYMSGRPVLWRRCPVRGGYRAMQEAVKLGLGLDESMVVPVLEDTLIDPRSALEPFLGPILNELDLSRAYLVGKHGMSIDRILLSGLPAGGQHVRSFARESFHMELLEPGVFDGIQQPPKGEIAGDCAFLPALGAALAASEVER
ncbi:MAG: hypothetical protein IKE55_04955 [Kiritimatiellae bacterium]|nr:hypothetical protein [Kiritimatiellia bacterium]